MAHFFLVTLALVVCSLILVSGNPFKAPKADAHDVYQCPNPLIVADTPLCKLSVKERGLIFNTKTKDVYCPDSGVNKLPLACIIVKNLDNNDNGGYASIVDGGLNDYRVEIRLKSQWGKGLNFEIEVYTVAQNIESSTSSTSTTSTSTESPTTTSSTDSPTTTSSTDSPTTTSSTEVTTAKFQQF